MILKQIVQKLRLETNVLKHEKSTIQQVGQCKENLQSKYLFCCSKLMQTTIQQNLQQLLLMTVIK